MEIKESLQKPFTDEEREEFVFTQNHTLGYEIRETETALEAWGETDSEKLISIKSAKYSENDSKAETARESQGFTVTLEGTELAFITDRKTQQDLQTALTFLQAGQSYYTWIDENGTSFNFTSASQILTVSETFMEKANIYPKWQHFKQLIDAATTVEEVNAITIDYGINLED